MNTLKRHHRKAILLGAAVLAAVMALSPIAASTEPNATPAYEPATGPRKPAAKSIRTVSFKLKDSRMTPGEVISGRVISDDRGQITVAEVEGGRITQNSYSRLDFEPHTIKYQTVGEYQYWMATGQYFEGRTWDWQDDADEFAQALRCYMTAQDLATASSGKESKAAQDAEEHVNKLVESRQRWIETTKPRAAMAELELKSTLAKRLDKIDRSLVELRSDFNELNQWHKSYDESLAAYKSEMNIRLDRLSTEIAFIRSGVYTQPGVRVTPIPTSEPMK